MRLDLNGEWEARMPDGEMRTVPVPGCFDRGLGRWDEARPARYRRTFRLEKREPAELFFSGVSYACEISLNDVSLGGHEGLWDGFWVDTRDALREGENELTVVVTKPGYDSNDAYPLRQVLSGFIPDVLATFGGLWDDVALETASPLLVRRAAADGDADGALRMDAEIRAQADGTALSTLTLFDPDGAPVCTLQERTALRAGDNAWSQEWRVDAPRLWSAERPALYRARWTLEMDGARVEREFALGFRTIAVRGPRLYMNGHPVQMRGILHWGCYDDEMIDCREWHVSDLLLEAEIGSGRLMATTLRLEGGMGKEPSGIGQNPFAVFLLRRCLRALTGLR